MRLHRPLLAAGLAGGAAINLTLFATFRLVGFGLDGGGVLLDPLRQSPKLIAVWTELEPLPLLATRPWFCAVGLGAFGFAQAFVYAGVAAAWPPGFAPRTLRFAGLLFGETFLFWELFTPFAQLGEPPTLVALELAFWAVVALGTAAAVAWPSERRSRAWA